jgi:hypothetical protein
MKIAVEKIKKLKITPIKKITPPKIQKVKMPGLRFGPPPKKGPSSQGMKMGGYISRQNKNK